jgi:hypothetical protein
MIGVSKRLYERVVFMARTPPRSTGRKTAQARPWGARALLIGSFAVLLISGWYLFGRPRSATQNAGGGAQTTAQDTVDFPHIHGLGYSADGKQLLVPAHTGLRVFAEGTWQRPNVPANDYMGYAATSDGFYSSGHPGPGARLPNPIGLVKSTDGGKELKPLGFAGESDFHLMGVGYQNHAIYVLNPAPNSKLATGLQYSLDDGRTWQQSAMRGVTSQPVQIAVHPTQANIVALASEGGLFLSTDHGNAFTPIGEAKQVTAAAFNSDGGRLFFGSNTLSVYDITSTKSTTLSTPPLGANDAISYVATNPVQADELAIATFGLSIYRSVDGGRSWEQIAKDGLGRAGR